MATSTEHDSTYQWLALLHSDMDIDDLSTTVGDVDSDTRSETTNNAEWNAPMPYHGTTSLNQMTINRRGRFVQCTTPCPCGNGSLKIDPDDMKGMEDDAALCSYC